MDQVNFIDFLKSLITGTISAVSETQYEQENKIIELKKDLLASTEYLIEKYDLYEEAKLELGEKAKEEEVKELVEAKIVSLKELLSTYFENGYVKTIIDKGKISAKFIYQIHAEEAKKKEIIDKKIEPLKEEKTKVTKMGAKLSNLDKAKMSAKMQLAPSKVFKIENAKVNKISENLNIKTPDPIKDKDLLNATQNLMSTVEIEFRTVIAN